MKLMLRSEEHPPMTTPLAVGGAMTSGGSRSLPCSHGPVSIITAISPADTTKAIMTQVKVLGGDILRAFCVV